MTTLNLRIHGEEGGAQPVSIAGPFLVVAGYTGRDERGLAAYRGITGAGD